MLRFCQFKKYQCVQKSYYRFLIFNFVEFLSDIEIVFYKNYMYFINLYMYKVFIV